MSGIFGGAQRIYAARRIATFPVRMVGVDKKPAITGYQRIGLPGSAQLAEKHGNASMVGFMTNARNGIAVLDVDSTDERVFADALGRYGDTPVKVRTASGKHHAYYRFNGERRRIRPIGDLPVDVLGSGGYTVAPPSVIAGKGTYRFIEGGLDDLDRLPVMRGLPPHLYVNRGRLEPSGFISPLRGMREHDGRNEAMFRAIGPTAREIHRRGGTREQLFAMAMKHNAECQPMEVTEVNGIVDSVWNKTVEGKNYIGRPGVFIDTPDFMRLLGANQDALLLLQFLRLHQNLKSTFMCANKLADKFGWHRIKLANARRCLIELGYIKYIRQAGRGHPALFRWEPTMF